MKTKLLAALALAAGLGCSDVPTQPKGEVSSTAMRVGGPAPLLLAPDRAAGILPTRFIVVLNDDAPDAGAISRDLARALGLKVYVVWNTGLRFFAAEMPQAALDAIRLDPRVKYVEEDQKVDLYDSYANPPSWGLDRIDQHTLPLNQTYQDHLGGNTTLSVVNAYIIDTGIRYSHTEFEGRASPAFDFDSVNHPRGSPDFGVDCFGHGTHVAGTVGGKTFGVAKTAHLFGVRVLDCSGSDPSFPEASRVISGVNWVTSNAVHPAVANMSLGKATPIQALDDAVRISINSGVTYVIAAGNSGGNACNGSPARVTEAIIVGATSPNDQRANFSNFGSCVDVFAPGTDITSAWYGADTQIHVDSGTSMAAPHVAGTVANWLSFLPDLTPSQAQAAITTYATAGAVGNAGAGSPNRLLYSIYPFFIRMTGPVNLGCGQTGTYTMEGAGGVGPYSGFHGHLSHTYGDEYKTWTGTTFVEQTPVDGDTQSMLVVGQATDTRSTTTEIDFAAFICEYF